MNVPFTGQLMLDAALAFLFFLAGIWIAFRVGSKIGWVILAASIYWAYLLFEPLTRR